MKLTATQITKLQRPLDHPAQNRYIVWSDFPAGLGVRIYTSGRKSYVLKYRVGRGRGATSRLVKLGDVGTFDRDFKLDWEKAQEKAVQIIAKAREGIDPYDDQDARIRVKDLMARFLAEIKQNPNRAASTYVQYEAKSRLYVVPILGRKPLQEVTRRDVIQLRDRVRELGGPGAANQVVGLLGSAFTQAELWGLIEERSSPVYRIPRFKTKQHLRYLQPHEIEQLLKVVIPGKKEHDIILLLLYTGARVSEIIGLRWEEVDLVNGRLNLRTSKTGEAARVLVPQAVEILRRQDRFQTYVFETRGRKPFWVPNIRKIWKALLQKAGLDLSLRLHDLRHNTASWLAQQGTPLPVIQRALGHRDIATTMRYLHLDDRAVREALTRIADTFDLLRRGEA